MKFAIEKPAFRIIVNSPSSVGAVGYTTGLMPSMTLGPGTWGGSIISENVSAMHLMNIKMLAFETNPVNKGSAVNSLDLPAAITSPGNYQTGNFTKQIEERLRARAGNPFANPLGDVTRKGEGASGKYGTGISEEEIQKIIKEFNR